MTLRIPVTELNRHQQNNPSQGAGELVNWQLSLPVSAYPGNITMDMTSVATIARASQLAGLFVLPDGRREGPLEGCLHSGFPSRLDGMTGQKIASDALNMGGNFTFEAAAVAGGALATYGCILLNKDLIHAELRKGGKDESPKSWAEKLGKEFASSLQELALGNIYSCMMRAIRRGRIPTAAALLPSFFIVTDTVREAKQNGGLISLQQPPPIA